jgi:hypothetical protein
MFRFTWDRLLFFSESSLLRNNSSNFNIPASGSNKKATYTHAGKLILTSVYDGVDYRTTANAALKNTRNDSKYCYFQLGGETLWENMTVDVTSALKCKSELDLQKKIEKANVDYKSQLVIEEIMVY